MLTDKEKCQRPGKSAETCLVHSLLQGANDKSTSMIKHPLLLQVMNIINIVTMSNSLPLIFQK